MYFVVVVYLYGNMMTKHCRVQITQQKYANDFWMPQAMLFLVFNFFKQFHALTNRNEHLLKQKHERYITLLRHLACVHAFVWSS